MLPVSPFSKRLNRASDAARNSQAKKRLANDFSDEEDGSGANGHRLKRARGDAIPPKRRPFSYIPVVGNDFGSDNGAAPIKATQSAAPLRNSGGMLRTQLGSGTGIISSLVPSKQSTTPFVAGNAKNAPLLASIVSSRPRASDANQSVLGKKEVKSNFDGERQFVMPSGRFHRRLSVVAAVDESGDANAKPVQEDEVSPVTRDAEDAFVREMNARMLGEDLQGKGRYFRVRVGQAQQDTASDFRPPPAHSRPRRGGDVQPTGNYVRTNLRNKNFRRGARSLSSKVLRKIQKEQRDARIARAEGNTAADESVPNVRRRKGPTIKAADGSTVANMRVEAGSIGEDGSECTDDETSREPATPIVEDPTVNLIPTLSSVFGLEDGFRPGQEETIRRILRGESALTVLPTGAGKSLCYQLPAFLACGGKTGAVCVVVSPLLALMDDQELHLPPAIKGSVVRGALSKTAWERVASSLRAGKVHVLFATPEAVAGNALQRMMRDGNVSRLAFACIDEAHCVTEWSHNFRPSYAKLNSVLRDTLNCQTILALTATATVRTSCEIASALEISAENVVRGPAVPPNLRLTASVEHDRDAALARLLQSPYFGPGCGTGGATIVYCARQADAERVAIAMRTRGIAGDCEAYHGGLSAAERKRVQACFSRGKISCIAATVAFGMGIDRSDVRRVIHYSAPPSLEQYVQEVGRAGRDGSPAFGHAFLDPADECLYRARCDADCPSEPHMLRIVRGLLRLGSDDTRIEAPPPANEEDNGNARNDGNRGRPSLKAQNDRASRIGEGSEGREELPPKTLWDEVETAVRAAKVTGNGNTVRRRLVLVPSQAEFALDVRMETIMTVLTHLEEAGAVSVRPSVRVGDLERGSWENALVSADGAGAGTASESFGGGFGRGFGGKRWGRGRKNKFRGRSAFSEDSAAPAEYAACYELEDGWDPSPEAVAELNGSLCAHFEAMRDSQRGRISRVFGCLASAAVGKTVSEIYPPAQRHTDDLDLDEGLHRRSRAGSGPGDNAAADYCSSAIVGDISRYFCQGGDGDGGADYAPKMQLAPSQAVLDRASDEILSFVRRNRSVGGLNGRAVACILLGIGTPRFKARDWARAPGWGRLREAGCDFSWIRSRATVAQFPALEGARESESDGGDGDGNADEAPDAYANLNSNQSDSEESVIEDDANLLQNVEAVDSEDPDDDCRGAEWEAGPRELVD